MNRDADLISAGDLYQTPIDERLRCITRVNSREANPGVMRPLDVTVVALPTDHGIRRGLRDLGIRDIDPPAMLGRIHLGRWYVNLSWVMWQADILPFTTAEDWEAHLFGKTGSFQIVRPKTTRSQLLRRNIFFPRLAFRMAQAIIGRKNRLNASLAARTSLDPTILMDSELDQLIQQFSDQVEVACNWLTRGSLYSIFLVSLLSRFAGSSRMPQVVAVLSDLGEIESAAPALRIREIANRLRTEYPEAAKHFGRSSDRLAFLRQSAPPVAAEVERLLQRYGYRSVAEIMITAPSWADDPQPVLDSISGLVESELGQEHEKKSRDEALKALISGFGPIKAMALHILARGAHLGGRTREECKANFIVRVDMLRRLFREIGVRLAASGVLDRPADVQYLTLNEVRRAFRTEPGFDAREIVEVREKEAHRLEAIPEPPELIDGDEVIDLSEGAVIAAGSLLTGQGVSGGVVEGFARVVNSAEALDDFEPGEILVAPYTDAGWTPYFTLAAGVVVETGGLLTHTSVVAREMGLPSVVGVRDVTRLLCTGDRLRLDPVSGTIEVISRTAATIRQSHVGSR